MTNKKQKTQNTKALNTITFNTSDKKKTNLACRVVKINYCKSKNNFEIRYKIYNNKNELIIELQEKKNNKYLMYAVQKHNLKLDSYECNRKDYYKIFNYKSIIDRKYITL